MKKIKNICEIDSIAYDMSEECKRAIRKFHTFNSPHEGYAVLKEELDELWEEVKKYPKQNNKNLEKEAIQIGAMAIRFVYDLILKENKNKPTKKDVGDFDDGMSEM